MRLFLSFLMAGLLAGTTTTHPLVAQGSPPAGLVEGVVLDLSGAPVAGATVDLLDRTGVVVRTSPTDERGAFRFDAVETGVYVVRASAAPMFATVRVAVSTGPAAPLRLVLTAAIAPTARPEPPGTLGGLRGQPAPISPPPPPAPPRDMTRSSSSVAILGEPATLHAQSGERSIPSAPSGAFAPPAGFDREAYARIDETGFRRVVDSPLSTFSIDVDTASYANVRRFLDEGRLPPADAVRLEEMLNYFRFDYPEPDGDVPFSVTTEVGPAPWAPAHGLVLIGLKGRALPDAGVPRRNLVFLLDVSGSMQSPDKLPLVKEAMRMLASTLTAADRVSIVVYASGTGVVLEPTSGAEKAVITGAIDQLRPGGSTAGGAGIQLAYEQAKKSFIPGGVNRVILATDGDFNVGISSTGELIRLIEEKRTEGVFLSVLGVGTGNLNDEMMEQLADRGNGNYSYLDSLLEARRVLISEANATFVTLAKDVKIQVEFNPARVGAYRLIGYENRVLANQDFADDTKDAGEIGAGHTVTALYEIVPPDVDLDVPGVDPLKYQTPARPSPAASSGELMTVKLRYKAPDGDTSMPLDTIVRDRAGTLTANLGFAASVAEFAMLLRDSDYKSEASWTQAAALAREHRGSDPDGYRAELVRLIDLAAALRR